MKKIIHKYLDSNYYIIGTYVYPIEIKFSLVDGKFNNTKLEDFVYAYYIFPEVNKIFSITKKQFKWYLKSWCRSKNKGFNFRKVWVVNLTADHNPIKIVDWKLCLNRTDNRDFKPTKKEKVIWNNICKQYISVIKGELKEIDVEDVETITKKNDLIDFYRKSIVK